jgi:hypothetical protein
MNKGSYAWIAVAIFISASSYAQPPAEERIRAQVREAVVNTSKLYGSQTTISLYEPIRSYVDLGLIMQPDGKVLLVRRGSVADDMGLTPGDTITKIDTLSVNEKNFSEIIGYLEALEHEQQFQISIKRNNQIETLAGTAKATVIPGWQLIVDNQFNELDLTTSAAKGCGRVSVFQQPPELHDLYPALITSIAGKPIEQNVAMIRLTPGLHHIGVTELISANNYQRPRFAEREQILEVSVTADTTFYIAAQYPSSTSSTDQDNWRPKVWKRSSQSCQSH